MTTKFLDFPNFGVIETMLDDKIVNNLWELIDSAKKNNIPHNKNLAGNITSSLQMTDDKNLLMPILIKLIQNYVKKYGIPYHTLRTGNFTTEFLLDSLWVNFQNENEFNPMHTHTGAFSFVIWMKIPTNHIDQRKIPIAKNSGNDLRISNFAFSYIDVIGQVRELVYPMSKQVEKKLLLFPSRTLHQVYPFYENKNERITISGNLGLVQNEKK